MGHHSGTPDAKLIGRRQKAIERAAFKPGDAGIVAILALGTPLCTALPDGAIRALSRLGAGALPVDIRHDATVEQIARAAGRGAGEARLLMHGQLEARLASLAFFLKDLVWRRGYRVEVRSAGRVEAALKRGRGAVLRIADFVFGGDVAKQALHRIGRPVSHMSRPEHGFSNSRFGLRFLNPIRIAAEDRYIHERIVFDRARPAPAVKRMNARLKENGIVSLLVCAYEGRSLVEIDFLNGKFRVAAGAPSLAFNASCPIFPVFTEPTPSAPNFTAHIGAPLRMTSADKEEEVLQAARVFVGRLEPFVLAHPHLWRGWPCLSRPETAVAGTAASPIAARRTLEHSTEA